MEAENALATDYEFDASSHLRQQDHQGYYGNHHQGMLSSNGQYGFEMDAQDHSLTLRPEGGRVKRLAGAASSANNNDITYESWSSVPNWTTTAMPTLPSESFMMDDDCRANSPTNFFPRAIDTPVPGGVFSTSSLVEQQQQQQQQPTTISARTSSSQQSMFTPSYMDESEFHAVTISSLSDDLIAESYMTDFDGFDVEESAATSPVAVRASLIVPEAQSARSSSKKSSPSKRSVSTPKRPRPFEFEEEDQESNIHSDESGELNKPRILRRRVAIGGGGSREGLGGYVRALVESTTASAMLPSSSPFSSGGSNESIYKRSSLDSDLALMDGGGGQVSSTSTTTSLVIIDHYRFV